MILSIVGVTIKKWLSGKQHTVTKRQMSKIFFLKSHENEVYTWKNIKEEFIAFLMHCLFNCKPSNPYELPVQFLLYYTILIHCGIVLQP